jgi:hypothetical protein
MGMAADRATSIVDSPPPTIHQNARQGQGVRAPVQVRGIALLYSNHAHMTSAIPVGTRPTCSSSSLSSRRSFSPSGCRRSLAVLRPSLHGCMSSSLYLLAIVHLSPSLHLVHHRLLIYHIWRQVTNATRPLPPATPSARASPVSSPS